MGSFYSRKKKRDEVSCEESQEKKGDGDDGVKNSKFREQSTQVCNSHMQSTAAAEKKAAEHIKYEKKLLEYQQQREDRL